MVCWPQEDGWFLATEDGGSWARSAGGVSWRHGPRDLVREAADAVEWGRENGSPPLFGFGVTVTRDRQEVWLGQPGTSIRCVPTTDSRRSASAEGEPGVAV
ncbi:hypothetical protein [Streptomyces millisiae]|uniref:Uncharacterized protein n=1 Tax=Streptomyces millisiae TaxID=3075542 RepID=A0ABU2LP96_9ACTN|nr:hypothetical protein [Streptomyces sp. DSM 44918]MDT0319403.1 hypothetical protein [Streptomyces sp. DSM 44918]